MKIERLDLTAYGCMTDVSLDLAATGGNMVVIYGQNEAGKSTVLNAIRDLLFGFEKSVEKVAFLHTTPAKLRIGGIISSGSEVLVAIRKKGNKGTLLGSDGKTLPDGAFDRFLKTITRDQFEQSFCLNLERLADGGHDLAEGKGELGAALFTAASPIANLQRQRTEIARRKNELFLDSARAANPTINADIKAYKQSEKEWKDKFVPASDAAQCESDVEAKQQALEGLKERESKLRNDLRQRVRLKESRALVLKYDDLNRERTPFEHIPPLRSSFAADCARVSPDLRQAETLLKGIDEELQRLEKEHVEAIVDVRILTVADRVRDLSGRQQSINGDMRELVADEQLLRNKLGEAKQALRDLGLPIGDVDRFLDALRLNPLERQHLRTLASDRVRLRESLDAAEKALADNANKLHLATGQLASLPALRETDNLTIAVEQSNRAGDVEVQTKAWRDASAKLRTEIATELKRLGSSKSIEEISATAVPSLEVIEDYRLRFEEYDREAGHLREDRHKAESERLRIKLELSKSDSSGSIPRPEERVANRTRRDRAWDLIRRAWLSGDWDSRAAAEFAGEQVEPAGLVRMYEASVAASDDIADRLATEADRVRARLELEATLQSLKERLSLFDDDEVRTKAASAILQAEWQSLWDSTAATPRSPRQMAEWRRSWDALCERVGRLDNNRIELAATEEAIAGIVDRLRRALLAAGENEAMFSGITGVADLTKFATLALKKHEKTADDRRLIEREVAAARIDVETAETQRMQKQNDLAAWKNDWEKATARLTAAGLTEVRAEQLNEVLDSIDEFYRQMNFRRTQFIESEKRRGRIDEWKAALVDVAKQLGERTDVGGDLDPTPLLATWIARVHAAGTAHTQRADRMARKADLERKRPERQAERDAVAEKMAALLHEAKVDCPDALSERISLADQLREIDRRVESEYRDPIRKLAAGAGRTVEQIELLAADAVGRDLQAEADAIERELTELDQQKECAAKELGEAAQRQTELLNRRGGIDERERMEAALARIRNRIPDYAALVLAEAVLSKAIERYRDKHKSDLFESASRLFCRLTCGRFVRLDIDQDDDDCQYLVGVRPDGETPDRVRLDGMSDGTCDQLYLALRLAHLEKHVADHGPFPIIVDDILLSFDDSRARAALQCLADLGSKTQVLFFTHHRHLRAMASQSEFQGQIGILNMGVGSQEIGKNGDEK